MSAWNTRLGWVTAVGAIALIGCGSGQEPGGGGRGGGQGGAVTSSATTSSSATQVVEGLAATIDGVAYHWTQGLGGKQAEVKVAPNDDGSVKFETIALFEPTLEIWIGDGLHTGDSDCNQSANGLNSWGKDGGHYITATDGGSCAISVTHVPATKGDPWVGTFSATLRTFPEDAEMKIENGTFNLASSFW